MPPAGDNEATSARAPGPALSAAKGIDLALLPVAARRVLSGEVPIAARQLAAKGIIPGLRPGDIATVIAGLTRDADPQVSATAKATLANLPAPIKSGALGSDLPAFVIELLAEHYCRDHEVIEHLLRMPQMGQLALELLATAADERAGELIATNESLLLQHPTVIEKIYMNKRVRMSTANRLLELAVRNNIELAIPAYKEAALAIKNELVAEPSPEPTFEDVLFEQTCAIDEQIALDEGGDTHEVDDEGEEKVTDRCLPLHAQIANMTITERIRAAMVGEAAMRLLLVRDPNRLVAVAAAKSPNLREPEAERIAASRSVSEDVLRVIALNREFTKNYQVKLNLVNNPRTPFTFSSRLIPHLRDNDLRTLAKSKNVPGAISQAVRQQLLRKAPK